MNNLTFILKLGAELLTLGAQAITAARGDDRKALELIRDRTEEIAELERSNDIRARNAILGNIPNPEDS